ncbi:MAG: chorismate synthase [Abditibacteriota bacterium]|nr:chorismate synthase [Abditibacteriota bacterium]
MKNTFGSAVTLTIFGESHGPEIGAVLDGLAPGMEVSGDSIRKQLDKRRPAGAISTARREADEFHIASGVFEGRTTGTPLTIIIPNADVHSRDYASLRHTPRPGHADYTAQVKYRGFQDYRGGGHFSGRITAALCAAGGILLPALEKKGILIGSHIAALGGGEPLLRDQAFSGDEALLTEQLRSLDCKDFPALDPEAEKAMRERILEMRDLHDSCGGILEGCIAGLPAGTGEPWFDTVEGVLSHALFGIPAVKGVDFGGAFDLAGLPGSEYNDGFCLSDSGEVRTSTNHNGGVNGGIANGMPILFRVMVKPTPSVFLPQATVDLEKGTGATLSLSGRHDPAVIHRAAAAVNCAAALAAADLLTVRYGADYLGE